MPFLSKDWRDPGDQWVRHDGGWEKKKTVSSSPGKNCEHSRNDFVAIDPDGNFVKRDKQFKDVLLRLDNMDRPFCQITVKNTPEVAGSNGLADAMIRLDFLKAITDLRRFNYVTNLMHILFSHDKFRMLSGASQKVLFKMLEVVADTVHYTNRNEHVLRNLLEQLHITLTIYHVWGSHLGSTHLFRQHVESRRKITDFVEKMQVRM